MLLGRPSSAQTPKNRPDGLFAQLGDQTPQACGGGNSARVWDEGITLGLHPPIKLLFSFVVSACQIRCLA